MNIFHVTEEDVRFIREALDGVTPLLEALDAASGMSEPHFGLIAKVKHAQRLLPDVEVVSA